VGAAEKVTLVEARCVFSVKKPPSLRRQQGVYQKNTPCGGFFLCGDKKRAFFAPSGGVFFLDFFSLLGMEKRPAPLH
jgi:hypothetical protein